MQPPRFNRHQDLDRRHPNPDLLSLHPAGTDAHARGSIGGNGTISHPRHDTKYPPRRQTGAACLILSGDFNRHHPAWGSNHIQPRFIEDASELINFFQGNGLKAASPGALRPSGL